MSIEEREIKSQKIYLFKFVIEHSISFKNLSIIVDIEEFKNHNFFDSRQYGYFVDTVIHRHYNSLPGIRALDDYTFNMFDEL